LFSALYQLSASSAPFNASAQAGPVTFGRSMPSIKKIVVRKRFFVIFPALEHSPDRPIDRDT